MGGRERVYAEFLLACIFLSLISWANKHRLSPDGQVRASLPPVLYLTELGHMIHRPSRRHVKKKPIDCKATSILH